jgi:hypothetical protein
LAGGAAAEAPEAATPGTPAFPGSAGVRASFPAVAAAFMVPELLGAPGRVAAEAPLRSSPNSNAALGTLQEPTRP